MAPVRRRLLEVYAGALAAVDGAAVTREALADQPPGAEVDVVAVGKAAVAMAAGARRALGGRAARMLVITKQGHGDAALFAAPGVAGMEAAHPLPDASSLRAGTALLAFLAAGPADRGLLFLISGGASSLVECLPPGVDAAVLERANRWLLGSGLDIHAVNRVRRALSAIKGGGLVPYLRGRRARVLAISDVPGNRVESIGSGLLWPVPHDDLQDLALPAWLREATARAAVPRRHVAAVPHRIVADNRRALEAAGRRGAALGLAVHVHGDPLHGDAHAAGRRLVTQPPPGAGLHLWGGETTVRLPENPGRGGRCQALALAAAVAGAGRTGWYLLAAGTDGTDGPGGDAGALVDPGTVERGRLAGLDPDACLGRADAGTFLEASGDLLHTGPTGTNVMDVVMLWRER